MSKNRKVTREEAVKIVYTMDLCQSFETMEINRYVEHFRDDDSDDLEFNLNEIDMTYLMQTVNDIVNNLEKIDQKIIENLKSWKFNRIAKVDLAILRVAIAEILYNPTIPESVSINEAVEISKKYSIPESHKFINGILGAIVRGL